MAKKRTLAGFDDVAASPDTNDDVNVNANNNVNDDANVNVNNNANIDTNVKTNNDVNVNDNVNNDVNVKEKKPRGPRKTKEQPKQEEPPQEPQDEPQETPIEKDDQTPDDESGSILDDLLGRSQRIEDTHVMRGLYIEKSLDKVITALAKKGGRGVKSKVVNEALKKLFKEKGLI